MAASALAVIVPLIAYAYVAFYGAVGHQIGKKNSWVSPGNSEMKS